MILGLVGMALADAPDVEKLGFAEVVREHAKDLSACYESSLRSGQALQGRVEFELDIAADGTVTSAKVAETTLNDESVEDCLVKVFEGMTFPAAKEPRTVVYPLVFAPSE